MPDQFRASARMLPPILLCLLFAIPLAVTAAQETISSSKLTDSIADIEQSISRLRPLVEENGNNTAADSDALVKAKYQRMIRLIRDVAKLTSYTASLPEDDPDRTLLQERLRGWSAAEDFLEKFSKH